MFVLQPGGSLIFCSVNAPYTFRSPRPIWPPLLPLVKSEVNEPALTLLVPVRGEGSGGVGDFARWSNSNCLFGVGNAGGIGTSCFVLILPRPLIAWPILSLRRRKFENDFLRCMDRVSSPALSSVGGGGRDGSAVIIAFLWLPVLDVLVAVEGRLMTGELRALLEKAIDLSVETASTPDILADECWLW